MKKSSVEISPHLRLDVGWDSFLAIDFTSNNFTISLQTHYLSCIVIKTGFCRVIQGEIS